MSYWAEEDQLVIIEFYSQFSWLAGCQDNINIRYQELSAHLSPGVITRYLLAKIVQGVGGECVGR